MQIYTNELVEGEQNEDEKSAEAEMVPDIGIDLDQENGDSDGSEGGGESEEAMRSRLLGGSSKEMLEMEEQLEANYNLQMKSFVLEEELDKINCSKYSAALRESGFADLVGRDMRVFVLFIFDV